MDKDDGVREGMTAKALSALKPVFKRNGTTTAGNSSQVRICARAHDHLWLEGIVCRYGRHHPFCVISSAGGRAKFDIATAAGNSLQAHPRQLHARLAVKLEPSWAKQSSECAEGVEVLVKGLQQTAACAAGLRLL